MCLSLDDYICNKSPKLTSISMYVSLCVCAQARTREKGALAHGLCTCVVIKASVNAVSSDGYFLTIKIIHLLVSNSCSLRQ